MVVAGRRARGRDARYRIRLTAWLRRNPLGRRAGRAAGPPAPPGAATGGREGPPAAGRSRAPRPAGGTGRRPEPGRRGLCDRRARAGVGGRRHDRKTMGRPGRGSRGPRGDCRLRDHRGAAARAAGRRAGFDRRGLHAPLHAGRRVPRGAPRPLPGRRRPQPPLAGTHRGAVADDRGGDGRAQPAGAGQPERRVGPRARARRRDHRRQSPSGPHGLLRQPRLPRRRAARVRGAGRRAARARRRGGRRRPEVLQELRHRRPRRRGPAGRRRRPGARPRVRDGRPPGHPRADARRGSRRSSTSPSTASTSAGSSSRCCPIGACPPAATRASRR